MKWLLQHRIFKNDEPGNFTFYKGFHLVAISQKNSVKMATATYIKTECIFFQICGNLKFLASNQYITVTRYLFEKYKWLLCLVAINFTEFLFEILGNRYFSKM